LDAEVNVRANNGNRLACQRTGTETGDGSWPGLEFYLTVGNDNARSGKFGGQRQRLRDGGSRNASQI